MNSNQRNVVWPSELQIAPHVIMAYVDISSAGLRALIFLKKIFLKQSISSQSYFGNIVSSEHSACAQAWKDCFQRDSDKPLEVFTVFNKDKAPLLSLLFVNAMLPVDIITGVAIDLIQGLMERKVLQFSRILYLLFPLVFHKNLPDTNCIRLSGFTYLAGVSPALQSKKLFG